MFSSRPIFRDQCNFTEHELKILALQITYSITEALHNDYVKDFYLKNCKVPHEQFHGPFLKEIYNIDLKSDYDEWCKVFGKYANYFNNHFSIRLIPKDDLIAMLPRLMLHMQEIIYALCPSDCSDIKNKKFKFINDFLYPFQWYSYWYDDLFHILKFICKYFVDNFINEYNEHKGDDKHEQTYF